MDTENIIHTLIMAGAIGLVGWFVILRPLSAIVDLPEILEKFIKEFQLLNMNLINLLHQLQQISADLHNVNENGIALRKKEKPIIDLPFLDKKEEEKNESVPE